MPIHRGSSEASRAIVGCIEERVTWNTFLLSLQAVTVNLEGIHLFIAHESTFTKGIGLRGGACMATSYKRLLIEMRTRRAQDPGRHFTANERTKDIAFVSHRYRLMSCSDLSRGKGRSWTSDTHFRDHTIYALMRDGR
ncbi:hypothetical protein J6590_082259 [Homalodisca vitripennis]|nr:hypothetical protein J6590_082259 [Homalodisca vitripennis]